MSPSDVKRYDKEYVVHSWSVQSALDPLVITRTQGVYMWDENGKRWSVIAIFDISILMRERL